MEIIYFLIACSIFIAILFLGAFLWANTTGQHDDTHTPAIRILFEDELIDHAESDLSEKKEEKSEK